MRFFAPALLASRQPQSSMAWSPCNYAVVEASLEVASRAHAYVRFRVTWRSIIKA